MAVTAERMAALEGEVTRIQNDFGTFKAALDLQREFMEDEISKRFVKSNLDLQEELQAASRGFDLLKYEIFAVVTGAREEFTKTNENLNYVYKNVDVAIGELKSRMVQVEAHGGQGGGGHQDRTTRGYLPIKNIVPKILDNKLEEWRQWKDDVLDFLDENNKGMRNFLVEVQKEETIDDAWLRGQVQTHGEKIAGKDESIRVWRALKGMTTGEARKVINTVNEENGFQAWIALHQRFEPGLAIQQGMILADFSGMVAKPAKTPAETRDLMTEIQRKVKNIEDITGEKVSDNHAKSVMTGVLDPTTRQHTAMFHGAATGPVSFMRKVLEFVNNASGANPDAMQIGSLGEQQGGCHGHDHGHQGHQHQEESWPAEPWQWGSSEQDGNINGLKGKGGGKGVQCYNCGEWGHMIRDCTKPRRQKGDPKGKGDNGGKGSYKGLGKNSSFTQPSYGPYKGDWQKGQSKGAPKNGNCWICGGRHFARDCPRNTGKGAGGFRPLDTWDNHDGYGQQGEIKALACLRHGCSSPEDSTAGWYLHVAKKSRVLDEEDDYSDMHDLVDSSDSEQGEQHHEEESDSDDEEESELAFKDLVELIKEMCENKKKKVNWLKASGLKCAFA